MLRSLFSGISGLRAHQTSYSSCRPEDMPDGSPGKPDWVLNTSEVYLDFAASDGTVPGISISRGRPPPSTRRRGRAAIRPRV